MYSDGNRFELTFPVTDKTIDDMFPNHSLAKTPRRRINLSQVPGNLFYACSECYVNCVSGADPADWCWKVCPIPHLPVWAKHLNRKYWPAKVIAVRHGKILIYMYGICMFKEVRVEQCLLFTTQDPNRLNQPSLDWMKGVRDVHKYVGSLAECYGFYQFASPGMLLDANALGTHLLATLQKPRERAQNTICVAASTSSTTTEAPAPTRKRTYSQRSLPAGDPTGDAILTICSDEGIHIEVCDDLEDAAVAQQAPPPDLMSKEEHRLAMEQLLIKHTKELARAKRRIWCTLCTEPAVMICCGANFFCSEECFLLHPHRRDCRKPFMANHVAVVIKPTPGTIPPQQANEVRPSEQEYEDVNCACEEFMRQQTLSRSPPAL